jgi:hypothetical protein
VLNGLLIYISFKDGLQIWILGYILFIALSWGFYILIKNQFVQVESFSEKSVIQSYSVFIFLLVLSLGLFPIIGFYTKSYNLEKELSVRSMQFDLTKKLATIPKKDFSNQYSLSKRLNDSVINLDTFNPNEIDLKNKVCESVGQTNVLSPSELKFIKNLRFTYDTKMFNSASIDFLQYDSNRNYNWGLKNNSCILYDQNLNIELKSGPDRFQTLYSGHSFSYLVFLVLGFIIYCFVFFYSVKYWSAKIFLLGLPHKKKKDEFELILKSFKFIYLISLPHSGVKRYLGAKYKNAHIISIRECDEKDFIEEQLNEIVDKQFENIILYDSDSFTEQLLKAKTKLIIGLIKLMEEKSKVKKLILVSNTHPSYKVKKIKRKDDNDTTALDQYLNVLGNFKRVFFPFGFLPQKAERSEEAVHLLNECDCEDSDSWSKWKDGYSFDKDSEASILNIQSLSQIQYFSIWNGLEKREQYLIYDLAQDGLANYKNMGVINNLLSKGILKYENMQLKLFNESFNNFVLTNVDREESLQIEHESKKSGNWSNLQLPFIMVIFALFAFLFITQQDAFNDIIAWLGTALVSLPLLIKTFASLSSFKFGKS